MTEEDKQELMERAVAALEKLADRPVVLPNGYVWDEQTKNWAHPDAYAGRRSS